MHPMLYRLFTVADRTQTRLWRAGIRFQWPCWFLNWAWDLDPTPGPGQLDRAVRDMRRKDTR